MRWLSNKICSPCHATQHTFSTPFLLVFSRPSSMQPHGLCLLCIFILVLFSLCVICCVCACVCLVSAQVSHFFFTGEYIKRAVTKAGEMKNMLNVKANTHSKYFQVDDYFDMEALGVLNLSFSHSTSLTYSGFTTVDTQVRAATTTATKAKSKQTNTARTRISNR